MIRYKVLDLPIKGTRAFTPLASTTPVATSQGLVKIIGYPGVTNIIPVNSPGMVPISFDKQTQGSNVAPNVISRSTYWTTADNMGPTKDAGIGMYVRRLVPLPVPAIDRQRIAVAAFHRIQVGGRTPTPNPRPFQRWY